MLQVLLSNILSPCAIHSLPVTKFDFNLLFLLFIVYCSYYSSDTYLNLKGVWKNTGTYTLLAYLPSHTKITITIKFISTSLIVVIRNLLKELMHPNQMHMVHSIFYLFSWQPIFALQVLFFSQKYPKYPILELRFFFSLSRKQTFFQNTHSF